MKKTASRRIVLAALAVVLCAAFAAPAQAAKAKAVFKETRFDFGRIKDGDIVTHEFIFKNEGTSTLIIKSVETTCGCTAALVSADKVEPGQEGSIKATFNSRGYDGRVVKYVIVHSNDSSDPNRELTITGQVEQQPGPRIELDKYNVDLGVTLEGEKPSTTVSIKNTGTREMSVEISHNLVSFFIDGKPMPLPLLIPAGDSREIELRLTTDRRPGIFRDYILVKSNDRLRSTLSISINGYIMSKEELKTLFKKYRDVVKD